MHALACGMVGRPSSIPRPRTRLARCPQLSSPPSHLTSPSPSPPLPFSLAASLPSPSSPEIIKKAIAIQTKHARDYTRARKHTQRALAQRPTNNETTTKATRGETGNGVLTSLRRGSNHRRQGAIDLTNQASRIRSAEEIRACPSASPLKSFVQDSGGTPGK